MKAWFHEDDDGAVEILPAGAWAHCERQLGRIAEHSEQNRAPGGVGWTSVYIREAGPVKFESLGITLAELDTALSPHLSSTDDVSTGYSSHREPVPRARAWVVHDYAALYAVWDEGGRVRGVFYVPSYVPPEKETPFLAALKALGALRPMLLVDWHADALILLDDWEALQRWLKGDEDEENEA